MDFLYLIVFAGCAIAALVWLNRSFKDRGVRNFKQTDNVAERRRRVDRIGGRSRWGASR